MTPLSFQLYSARFEPSITGFLPTLARAGYARVEGFPGVYDDPVAFRTAMDNAGLTMPTGHFPLEWVRDEPDKVKHIADVLGIDAIIVPAVSERERDAAGWRALGEELARAGETYWADGKTFGWHNHAFEFAETETGEVPLDLILGADTRLALELDIAWVQVGGQDAATWITKYAPRLAAVHIKDIAPEGECADEDGWADVGHGIMPWPALKAQLAAEAPTAIRVMEHDKPSDATRFATRSFTAYSEM